MTKVPLIASWLLVAFLSFIFCAQTHAQKIVRVKIERAQVLKHDDKIGKNTQSLNGNVVLSHGRTFLYCDSAYMFNDSNVVRAYGKIHVVQNDSIHLYGDHMTYYGNEGIVKVRDNVRANKGETWLYTEFLDYDKNLDQAYFFNGGRVENKQNTLVSQRGFYFPMTNDVYFKNDVVGNSPKYKLYSDTAAFNTKTEVVTILGPTTIVTSDSTIIKSDEGWYDTQADVAKLLKNNMIETTGKNHSTLTGRTLLYERRLGLATAWDDMTIWDLSDNMSLAGDYGFYNQETGEALATKKALVRHVYQNDTLFLHADTLQVVATDDSSHIIKAYHNAKFFRKDLQGRCDSLIFDFRDSVATMYNFPVVWSYENQMTANVIKIYSRQQKVYKSELIDAAFITSAEDDSVSYNQVKGKLITGHIRNNELYLIDVDGNGQTIYYPKDGPNVIGVNRAESSAMSIWLNKRKVSNITMRVTPTGNMNPPILLGEEKRKLAGFKWLDAFRPKTKEDIFKRLDVPEELIEQEEVYEGYSFDDVGEP